jgi:hypothetical protein
MNPAGRLHPPYRPVFCLALQAVEKWRPASLLHNIQILAYRKYASALNIFRAWHLTLFEQPG